MSTYIPRLEPIDRYDDGVTADYASMIRMWSAFDRSLDAFNRECGVVTPRGSSARSATEDAGKRRDR